MIEQIKYINHMNETIDIGNGQIFANKNDLHDFAWKVVSKNNRIASFEKGIVKKTIPLILKADSVQECIQLKDRLFEVCEKDVLATKHGKLIIGDYYMLCYVTESKKTEYKNDLFMNVSISIQSDFPYWIKETTQKFNYGAGTVGKNLDYNSDYPFDYTSNLLGKQLNNTNFVPTNFKMIIYGPIESPSITINGHVYNVNASIGNHEYLTIDSVNKTIVLTHSNGTTDNCFNLRNRESYIFEKMPVGLSNVFNSGNFKFDIVLLEERGEPKWI